MSSRSVPSVFAARAVDPRLPAKGGMHSGLTISHSAMIVPNSLLKVPQKSQFCQLLEVVLSVWEVNWTLQWNEKVLPFLSRMPFRQIS